MRTLELCDGQVIASYNEDTFELELIEDWNGNDLSGTKWEKIAIEFGEQLKGKEE